MNKAVYDFEPDPELHPAVIAGQRRSQTAPAVDRAAVPSLLAAGTHVLRRRQDRDRFALQKRLLDLTVAGLAAIVLAPLFLVIAIAIRTESRGPVFFCQIRVGKDGQRFRVWKFRSMVADAEARRAALAAQSDRSGLCFKARRDPRITRVGALLRRCSLDELPQILNILRGEMSVVGPRPGLPSEVAAYPARALNRLQIKPGLTGLWQVSGRAEIGFEQMIEMDLAYGAARSIRLDLILILATFRALWTGRGAY